MARSIEVSLKTGRDGVTSATEALAVRIPLPSHHNGQPKPVATLDFFWKDLYRPELFWRTFKPITGYNKNIEAIYVFKHVAG